MAGPCARAEPCADASLRAMRRLAPDVRHLDLRPARRLSGTALRVAISPDMPDRVQFRRDLVVACAATEERAEVMAICGKEAGVELALGREANARARATEGLRDRGDDSDLAGAVAVAVAARDLATVIRLDRLERPLSSDRPDDLRRRHDIVEPPTYNITGPPSVGAAGVSPVARRSFFIGFIESLRHREAPRYGSAWGAY